MAIVPIIHATIIGQAAAKTACLAALQEKGFLHIITTDQPEGRIDHHRAPAMEVYHYLRNCADKRRQRQEEAGFDLRKVSQQTLRIKEQTLVLNEERDYLQQRLKNLEPWGNFTFPALSETGGYRLWFYIIPLYQLPAFAVSGYVQQCVHKDNRNGYVVVLSKDEPTGLPVPRIHTGDKPLAVLRARLDAVEAALEDLHWRRIGLTCWLTMLARQLAAAEDQALLNRLLQGFYDDGQLFYFEAWLPASLREELQSQARAAGLVLLLRAPRQDEAPPTLLENRPEWLGGENLMRFYTTPAYHMWDPSKSIFLAFVLFFAMIVADAGYGLVLGLGWLLSRKKISCESRGLCGLFGAIVVATMLYGVLVGSYFGLAPGSGTMLGRLQLLDIGNKDQMIFLSICLGIGHLSLAHGGNFLFAQRPWYYLAPLGWIAAMAGGFCWWLGAVRLPEAQLLIPGGQLLLAAGGLCLLLFSSKRPAAGWQAMFRRLPDGLLALSSFSRAFGDVLSYLRLFALGLASAQLAITFNNLAAQAASGIAGLGTLLAIGILTVGHGLNLLLAVMSGIIHGLRLNYIEFLNWGLSEEGYAFKPFRKRRISLWNQL